MKNEVDSTVGTDEAQELRDDEIVEKAMDDVLQKTGVDMSEARMALRRMTLVWERLEALLREQIAAATDERDEYRAKLHEETIRVDRINDQADRLASVEAQLAASEKLLSDSREHSRSLEKKVATLGQRIEDERLDIQTLQDQRERLRETIAQKTAEVDKALLARDEALEKLQSWKARFREMVETIEGIDE